MVEGLLESFERQCPTIGVDRGVPDFVNTLTTMGWTMIDQVSKARVATNRCKDAFSAKSNPNRPGKPGSDRGAETAGLVPDFRVRKSEPRVAGVGTPPPEEHALELKSSDLRNRKPHPETAGGEPKFAQTCNPRTRRPPLNAEQQELVERYLPLAYTIAKERNRRRMKVGASDEINDLKAAAAMALVEAAGTFDPTRGVNFAVFSRLRIDGSLSDYERLVRWHNWRGRLQDRPQFRKLSLGAEREGTVMYMQELPPVGTHCDAADEVEDLLQKLPPLHEAACRLVYLEGKSQDEAARVLGYSKSYFSRVHQAALNRMAIGA